MIRTLHATINISDNLQFSNPLISLLAKSTKFIPFVFNHSKLKQKLISAVDELIRKIKWRWSGLQFSSSICRFGISRSQATPPDGLLTFEQRERLKKFRYRCSSIIKRCLLDKKLINSCNNLTEDEMDCLNRITKDESILILPVDKGGGWIIMDKGDYTKECLRQLSDTEFYKRIEFSLQSTNITNTSSWLRRLKGQSFINAKEYKFLSHCSQTPRKRHFYTLPKTHKEEWQFDGKIPPGRPIVSDSQTESSKISSFIDYFLNPLARLSPSYIRDSTDFISSLESVPIENLPSVILFTCDVTSLYTNIPIDKACQVVAKFFSKYTDRRRPDHILINLIYEQMISNDFLFNQTQYLQVSGVAMGKSFAPSLANLYMTDWEERLMISNNACLLFWKRYIDDIFGIWSGTLEGLNKFIKSANTLDRNIKLTFSYSYSELSFLDVKVSKDMSGNKLLFNVHFKPTHSFQILSPSSHHPHHTKRGILYSQIYCWLSICSTRDFFDQVCSHVFKHWTLHGYTWSLLRSMKRRVLKALNRQHHWTPGFKRCSESNCRVCRYAEEKQNITTSFGRYKILARSNCKTENAIYCIHCSSCGMYYVGQTSRPLFLRILEHLKDARTRQGTEVGVHFATCGLSSFSFWGLDIASNLPTRLTKESRWIKRLNSAYPNGLNTIKNTLKRLHCILPFSMATPHLQSCIRNLGIKNIRFGYKRDRNMKQIFMRNLP